MAGRQESSNYASKHQHPAAVTLENSLPHSVSASPLAASGSAVSSRSPASEPEQLDCPTQFPRHPDREEAVAVGLLTRLEPGGGCRPKETEGGSGDPGRVETVPRSCAGELLRGLAGSISQTQIAEPRAPAGEG